MERRGRYSLFKYYPSMLERSRNTSVSPANWMDDQFGAMEIVWNIVRYLRLYCTPILKLQHTLKSIWMESILYLGFREHKQVHVICSHLNVQTNIWSAAILDSSQHKEHVWPAKQKLRFSVDTGGREACVDMGTLLLLLFGFVSESSVEKCFAALLLNRSN